MVRAKVAIYRASVRMLMFFTVILCVGQALTAYARSPLIMPGKTTLYERVLTRPGTVLKRSPGDGPGMQQPALTRFYVYDRKIIGDVPWLEVGLTANGQVDGWVEAGFTLPWKQQLTLAFTNPSGRERALLFRDRDSLASVVEADQPALRIDPLRKAVLAGGHDPHIVSVEPENYVDLASHFYLLPILQAEETFSGHGHRVRMLEIASVSRDGGKAVAAPTPSPGGVSALRNFTAAVVFVIDSTVSMGPYIDRTREAVRRIYGHIEKAGLLDQVRFGMIAFRSNVDRTPELDYVSKVFADPSEVRSGKEFLDRVADLKAATVSSARFSEDAYAGIMTAVERIQWSSFGGRYVILITDAGALRGQDPLSSTRLDAAQVRLEAQHRGLAVYALHLKTPAGKANHAEAEAQYKDLTRHPLLQRPLYYPVESGAVDVFGAMVDALGDAIVEQVGAARRGESVPGAARTADPGYVQSGGSLSRVRQDAAMLGHAMQLAWLGRTEGTQAPPLFSAWIADRDLEHPEIPTTEVRVLLTRNQLSDLRQVLQTISTAGQAAQLSPGDFFAQLRSVAATLGRDPNIVKRDKARRLADLGLLGEYLDDLPYRSKVLDLDQQTWSSWSISQQQAFLDEIERKLRLYQVYNDDVSRWVSLDGGLDPGEAVYPVPLDAMP
ncbi:vWA domain-containing protein [Haematospirillum sp. H1815]|uniref:vWA domain-containing protein n=1 Tax=Haematospirillum sp. H1815 TaxID=2723108 RepID=UPI001FD78E58|nr:vWA domain-containing protein [Haematospirillum sp. H1815]